MQIHAYLNKMYEKRNQDKDENAQENSKLKCPKAI